MHLVSDIRKVFFSKGLIHRVGGKRVQRISRLIYVKTRLFNISPALSAPLAPDDLPNLFNPFCQCKSAFIKISRDAYHDRSLSLSQSRRQINFYPHYALGKWFTGTKQL